MKLFNPFKQPFDNETLESWSKNLDDIAKIALVAMPVLIYGQYGLLFKFINFALLCITILSSLGVSRHLRSLKLKE
ncbi:MAG: hypothetical protein Q4A60_04095 [Pasteurellaceae bacterium]|nr:hypothetical protein [Pasteurellaceae bacterium]